jgi:hypothetical protein
MLTSVKLGLTALVATLLLATAISTASARILSVSNQNIRATWASLEFSSSMTIRCRVTLEGSLHSRTIAKVARQLIGAITKIQADSANCTGGEATPRPEILPGHITYEGFRGALPRIDTVYLLLSRIRFQVIVTPVSCTGDYGTPTDNITGAATVEAGRAITSLAPVAGRNTVTLVTGSLFCPGSGTLVGTGSVMLLGTTNRILALLI